MKSNGTPAPQNVRRGRRTKQTLPAPRHVICRKQDETDIQRNVQTQAPVDALSQPKLTNAVRLKPAPTSNDVAPEKALSQHKAPKLNELVWVTVGKTEHQAWLLEDYSGKDRAMIRWESTRGKELVPALSIRHIAPNNGRARRTRAQTHRNGGTPTVDYRESKLSPLPRFSKRKAKVIDEPLFDDDVDDDDTDVDFGDHDNDDDNNGGEDLSFGSSSSSSIPTLSSTQSAPVVLKKEPIVPSQPNDPLKKIPRKSEEHHQLQRHASLGGSSGGHFPEKPSDQALYKTLGVIHHRQPKSGSMPVKKRRVIQFNVASNDSVLKEPLPYPIAQSMKPEPAKPATPLELSSTPSAEQAHPSTSIAISGHHVASQQKLRKKKRHLKKLALAKHKKRDMANDKQQYCAIDRDCCDGTSNTNVAKISMSMPIPRKSAPPLSTSFSQAPLTFRSNGNQNSSP